MRRIVTRKYILQDIDIREAIALLFEKRDYPTPPADASVIDNHQGMATDEIYVEWCETLDK